MTFKKGKINLGTAQIKKKLEKKKWKWSSSTTFTHCQSRLESSDASYFTKVPKFWNFRLLPFLPFLFTGGRWYTHFNNTKLLLFLFNFPFYSWKSNELQGFKSTVINQNNNIVLFQLKFTIWKPKIPPLLIFPVAYSNLQLIISGPWFWYFNIISEDYEMSLSVGMLF